MLKKLGFCLISPGNHVPIDVICSLMCSTNSMCLPNVPWVCVPFLFVSHEAWLVRGRAADFGWDDSPGKGLHVDLLYFPLKLNCPQATDSSFLVIKALFTLLPVSSTHSLPHHHTLSYNSVGLTHQLVLGARNWTTTVIETTATTLKPSMHHVCLYIRGEEKNNY